MTAFCYVDAEGAARESFEPKIPGSKIGSSSNHSYLAAFEIQKTHSLCSDKSRTRRAVSSVGSFALKDVYKRQEFGSERVRV